MATTNFIPSVLRTLSRDGWLLFVTRFARLFAYGSLSVILVFYLVGLGLSEAQVGLVLTLTLVGDVIVSLYLTTRADHIGRRRMLIVGSILAQESLGRRWIYGSCSHHGRGNQSAACGISVRAAFVDQHAVLYRRDTENCLRPAPLPFVSKTASP